MSANEILPREKALRHGIESLTNAELLALVLKSAYKEKNVFLLADEIIERAGGFHNLLSLSYEELIEIKGIKNAKALEILAILEIARRLSSLDHISREELDSPDKVVDWIRYNIAFGNEERFLVVFLNSHCNVIKCEVLFKGGKNGAEIGIDTILRRAILNKASRIIISHNHPSENVSPSVEDVRVTQQIKDSCGAIGIELLDHIIVSKTDFFSFKNNSLL